MQENQQEQDILILNQNESSFSYDRILVEGDNILTTGQLIIDGLRPMDKLSSRMPRDDRMQSSSRGRPR